MSKLLLVIKMLKLLKTSLTKEDINKMKIFSYFVDEELKSPEKANLLTHRIDKHISGINENNEYNVSYGAIFPPKSDFFIIEFMITTTFLYIIENYGYAQYPFQEAEIRLTDEVMKGLGSIMNDII